MFDLKFAQSKTPMAFMLLATTALCSHAAVAQSMVAADDTSTEFADTTEGDMIVVTASRTGVSGFDAPSPTTVIASDTLTQEGASNVIDALDKLPAFKATQSLGSNSTKSQNPGARPADLRGLGAQRTLVLVNGLRTVPQAPVNTTGATTSPDLSTIPSMLVDRVEVVTGGASAQWGSDAVAGVINIILKDDFTGLDLGVQKGISDEGDGGTTKVSALFGTEFAGGKGHFLVAADYQKVSRLGDLYSRDWSSEGYQLVSNSGYASNGSPALILSPNVNTTLGRGGLIIGPGSFSLTGHQFLPGGETAPFDYGQFAGSSYMIGGEGDSTIRGVSLAPGVERYDPYARIEYELGPDTTIYGDLSYSHSAASLITIAHRDRRLTIQRDNAFLPAAVGAALDADGLSSFQINRISYDFGEREINVKNEAVQGTIGVRGMLGASWQWDAAYRHGENRFTSTTSNNTITSRLAFAVDAVESGGQIVCRATLPGAGFDADAEGCVPINLFGVGSPSAEALAYVNQTPETSSKYILDTVVANLRGEPFSTWAGPVAVAVGAEYRKERQENKADPLAAAQQFSTGNGTPFTGSFSVTEGYLEAWAPLARDLPFMRSLDLNAAIRFAHYSSVGNQTTWKLGATWEPFDGMMLRTTRSRDIRAPALFELSSGGAALNATVNVKGISANIPTNVTIGNPNLNPEVADTFTAGVVFKPEGFLDGLMLSADYYDIKIGGAIANLRAGNAASLCTLGEQFACDFFTFAADGTPTSLTVPSLNLGSLRNKGIDFVLAYQSPLIGDLDYSVNLAGTHVRQSRVDLGTGGAAIDRAGEVGQANLGALPSWRFTLSQTLSTDDFSLTGQVRFISKSKIDNRYNSQPNLTISDNDVPAVAYVNFYGRYFIGENKEMELFFAIDNLFDKAPPPVPYTIINAPTNGQFYDKVGRFFRVGATLHL